MIELIIEPVTVDICPQCHQDWDLFHTLDWNNTENYLKCEGE